MDGESFYLTGTAGSGKSTVMREIVTKLREAGTRVTVTALTGCAAVNIAELGATTFHSFLGMGLCNEDPVAWLKYARKHKAGAYYGARLRFKATRTLIIEEGGMLTPRLLRALHVLANHFNQGASWKHRGEWGCLKQVIVVGDAAQLAGIAGEDDPRAPDGSPLYFFEDPLWTFKCIFLATNFRQAADPVYAALLNRMRHNKMTASDFAALESRRRPPGAPRLPDTIPRLYARNMDADHENDMYLARHDASTERTYASRVTGAHPWWFRSVPPKVVLRVGVRVMLRYNISVLAGHVNGSMGVVEALSSGVVHVLFDGDTIITRVRYVTLEMFKPGTSEVDTRARFMPFMVACAMSIHKAQGKGMKMVAVDLDCFAPQQWYVAASRCETLSGLHILRMDTTTLRTCDRVLAWESAGCPPYHAHARGVALAPKLSIPVTMAEEMGGSSDVVERAPAGIPRAAAQCSVLSSSKCIAPVPGSSEWFETWNRPISSSGISLSSKRGAGLPPTLANNRPIKRARK
jgi:hypothetical protein